MAMLSFTLQPCVDAVTVPDRPLDFPYETFPGYAGRRLEPYHRAAELPFADVPV